MTERWILAAVFLGAGLIIGAALGWFVRRRLIVARGGDATSSIAGASGLFVFWIFVIIGALAAVGMVNPDTLEDVPRQVLDYTPRLLSAGLILLAGYALGLAASRLVSFGLERASGRTAVRITNVVRWVVVTAAVILALAQLGVDTTILVILVGVAAAGFALSGALLIGLGGRDIAREIAAGRYLTRYVTTGSVIESGEEAGRIVTFHPATAELETTNGHRRHVPYTRLLAGGVTMTEQASGRATADDPGPDDD